MSADSLPAVRGALVASAAPLPLPVPPPPPPPPPGGFRRRPALLGSLAAVLAGPAIEAAATAHPDAELIDLCRRFMVLTDQVREVFRAMPEQYTPAQEEAYDAVHLTPLEAQQEELFGQIERVRAKTIDGMVARIRAAVHEYPHLLEDRGGDEAMVKGILLDGMALVGGRF